MERGRRKRFRKRENYGTERGERMRRKNEKVEDNIRGEGGGQ